MLSSQIMSNFQPSSLPFGGFSQLIISTIIFPMTLHLLIIGNALNYAENSVATLKSQLPNNDYLRPFYPSSVDSYVCYLLNAALSFESSIGAHY